MFICWGTPQNIWRSQSSTFAVCWFIDGNPLWHWPQSLPSVLFNVILRPFALVGSQVQRCHAGNKTVRLLAGISQSAPRRYFTSPFPQQWFSKGLLQWFWMQAAVDGVVWGENSLMQYKSSEYLKIGVKVLWLATSSNCSPHSNLSTSQTFYQIKYWISHQFCLSPSMAELVEWLFKKCHTYKYVPSCSQH